MNTNLLAVIRNSLAAANAALELMEFGSHSPAVMAAPAHQEPSFVEPNEYQPSGFDRLMKELEDPRYTLRSVRELCEKTGMMDVKSWLEDRDIEYITKRRRSDGAELIGLAERN